MNYAKTDGLIFAVIICMVVLLWGWTLHKQVKTDDCRMTLPKIEGKFCQKRDSRGNIMYVSADRKINVTIGSGK